MKLESLSARWHGMQTVRAEDKPASRSLASQIQAQFAKTSQSARTEKTEESPEAIKRRQELIVMRMRCGQKLSRSDLVFLKQHALGYYHEAVRIEENRRLYEREIRACRSKKEVEAVRMRWQQMYLAELKAIERSQMSFEEKKMAKEAAQMRYAAREDTHLEFRNSPAYQKLPDEEDENVNSVPGIFQEVIRLGVEKRDTDMEGVQEMIMAALREKMDGWEKMAGTETAATRAAGQGSAESGNDPVPVVAEYTISVYA
ncbi:MAG: hypothetical protein FWG81_07870 [Betaproteobacteria bacterium]|nr:hypothetical protein [Betaproteobacteria bacterium]